MMENTEFYKRNKLSIIKKFNDIVILLSSEQQPQLYGITQQRFNSKTLHHPPNHNQFFPSLTTVRLVRNKHQPFVDHY